jgi:hypothetical protein
MTTLHIDTPEGQEPERKLRKKNVSNGQQPDETGSPETAPAPSVSLKEALAGHVSPAATPPSVGARPTIEELRAALGPQPNLGDIDKAPVRWEIREPRKEAEYFRVHQERSLWMEGPMLPDREGFDKATYPVSPAMQISLQRWLKRMLMVPCVNVEGEFFLWAFVVADIMRSQRTTKVETAKRAIVQQATEQWTAMVWDGKKHIGVSAAENGVHLGQPKWPEKLSTGLILERCFASEYISSTEHEIAKVYLGLGKR